jgi:hypothetical protein
MRVAVLLLVLLAAASPRVARAEESPGVVTRTGAALERAANWVERKMNRAERTLDRTE